MSHQVITSLVIDLTWDLVCPLLIRPILRHCDPSTTLPIRTSVIQWAPGILISEQAYRHKQDEESNASTPCWSSLTVMLRTVIEWMWLAMGPMRAYISSCSPGRFIRTYRNIWSHDKAVIRFCRSFRAWPCRAVDSCHMKPGQLCHNCHTEHVPAHWATLARCTI